MPAPGNGCELEIHALNNASLRPGSGFGLRFVASPRHADVLMVTGPVTKNMREALQRTYDATPDPKMGGRGRRLRRFDGGIFSGSYAVVGGVQAVVPVDLVHIWRLSAEPNPIAHKGLLALLEQQ